MKRFLKNSRAGFTLMEMIIVVAIIGILAAIAVPSVLGFIERGKQSSRENVARTIYLAAQNRLTELRITRGLDKFANGLNDTVKSKLGDDFPDSGNENDVVYISHSGSATSNDPVIQLLNPVILDKTILNDAIVIEFNKKTGIVLSAFYSDALGSTKSVGVAGGFGEGSAGTGSLGYTGTAADTNPDNIVGPRGAEYTNTLMATRKQGYYGVDETGNLEDLNTTLINIYDSYNRPLQDDDPLELDLKLGQDALYAEIYMPASQSSVFSLYIEGYDTPIANQGDVVKDTLFNGLEGYSRFIWVLDQVGGNMTNNGTSNEGNSIGKKPLYKAALDVLQNPNFDINSNIHVSISGDTASATSFTEAHPYFNTDRYTYNGEYTIVSARHLYNIRYQDDAKFTQKADIELLNDHKVFNFAPIGDTLLGEFRGTYNGEGYKIENLVVDVTNGDAGLFGTISGSVTALTLDNPSVKSTGGNAGAVAGTLDGGEVVGTYVRFTNATASITSVSNVAGGIVGLNDGGTLTDSTFISSSSAQHISGGTAGGIVGTNSGTLESALFLALAPANSTTGVICPIVGSGSGDEDNDNDNLYYLSGTALRPTDMEDDPYNSGQEDNGVGLGLGTVELFELRNDFSGWGIKRELDPEDPEADLLTSTVYPYIFSEHSRPLVDSFDVWDWPLVMGGGISMNEIFYYEQYGGTSYGVWTATFSSLRNDLPITEAGYAIIKSEAPTGTHTISARVNTVDDWNEIDPILSSEYKNNIAFSKGLANAAYPTLDPSEVYVFVLDLDELSKWSERSQPLQIACDDELIGYMQPLFARGVYRLDTTTFPNTHGIRTPWQMKNISALTENTTTNETVNNIFNQELDLDFSIRGKGVYDAQGNTVDNLRGSAVTGDFKGTYKSTLSSINKVIKNVTISSESTTLGLFAKNSGIISDITLQNANITGADSVGGISSTNSGTITSIVLQNVSVSGVKNVGGIAGTNGATGRITNISVSNTDTSKIIKGTADNVGGIAGTSSGAISNITLQNASVSGANNIGGIAGTSNSTITDIKASNTSISGSENNIGGIAGANNATGTITNVSVSYTDTAKTIKGTGSTSANIGGIAGNSSGAISIITLQNASVSGNANIGGVAGTNSGTISAITQLLDADVSGANNVGGVAGTNSATGTITNVSVTYTNTTRTIKGTGSTSTNIGGIAGNSSGAISIITLQNASVSGNDNIGGIAGTSSGAISDCTVQNADVSGAANIGGIAGTNDNGGTIADTFVSYTNGTTRTIRGTGTNSANIGGIAGQNSDTISDSVFISSTNTVHISGKNYVGGIVGTSSVKVDRVMFFALAPSNTDGTTIYPIVGNYSGHPLDTAYYLYGTALRPLDASGNSYDYNTATPNFGTGRTTAELHALGITDTGWTTNTITNPADVISTANTVYPYPVFNGKLLATDWPITTFKPIELSNIYYYEKYDDDSYGLWSLGDEEDEDGNKIAIDNLKIDEEDDDDDDDSEDSEDDIVIIEAGYAVILQTAPMGTNFFGASNGVSSSPWSQLTFSNSSDLAIGAAATMGDDVDVVWAVELPLADLAGIATTNKPLEIMQATNAAGSDAVVIEGFLQPLFAKGLYESSDGPDDDTFFIRTPWQMRNISKLTGTTNNTTTDITFTQELDLDFSKFGKGVFDAAGSTSGNTKLSASAVTGDFKGTYNGNDKNIDKLTITSTSDDIGLFAVNSGSITNVTLKNADISGKDYVGGIAGKNSGSILNVEVYNAQIDSTGNDVGGVAGQNSGTITGAFVRYDTDKYIKGTGNVGGIAGENNKGTLRDSVFISTTDKIHISGGTAGGIVGKNNGTLEYSLFLALAPTNEAKDEIYPIVGGTYSGTADTTNRNKLYYLTGIAVRPVDMANKTEVEDRYYNTAESKYGEGLATADMNVLSLDGWTITTINADDVIKTDNTIYPYPVFNDKTLDNDENDKPIWPITKPVPIKLSDVVYYEKYSNGSYGFWSRDKNEVETKDGSGNITAIAVTFTDDEIDNLKNAVVIEAGYAILQTVKPTILNNTTTLANVVFANNTDLANAAATAAGAELGDVWAAVLPLESLTGKLPTTAAKNQPLLLNVKFDYVESGKTINKDITVYLHPLFAKGLYTTQDELTEFSIRTPWQMKNINFFTGGTNATAGRTFNQEVEIDFSQKGIGVNAALGYTTAWTTGNWNWETNINLTTAIVTGAFNGTYDGNNNVISNLIITATADIAMFARNNATGIVKNFTLKDADISSTGGSNIGAIVASNAGTVENVTLQDVGVTYTGSTGANVGGVVGMNSQYSKIIGAYVSYTKSGKKIDGGSKALNVGGIAGSNGDTISDSVFISSTADSHIVGANYVGGIAGNNTTAGAAPNTTYGKINRVLFLAVAPSKTTSVSGNKNIYPIISIAQNNTTLNDAYYLLGENGVRPSSVGYNTAATNYGEGLTTSELNQLPITGWTGWSKNNNANITVTYPYPIYNGMKANSPNWPIIAGELEEFSYVVYYERYEKASEYEDDYYGYYYGTSDGDSLIYDESKKIVESGYGIVSTTGGAKTFTVGGTTYTNVEPTVASGMYLYKFDQETKNPPTSVDNLIEVVYNSNTLGCYHPNFAKAVYTNANSSSKLTEASIRTQQQMQNISLLSTGITFTQELNLDFKDKGTLTASVVDSDFKGIFDGNGKTITGVTIDATGNPPPNNDNIGLFSENSGTITSITFRGTTDNPVSIKGNDNVGGIIGRNNVGGFYGDCTVDNITVTATGGTNVDDIVGFIVPAAAPPRFAIEPEDEPFDEEEAEDDEQTNADELFNITLEGNGAATAEITVDGEVAALAKQDSEIIVTVIPHNGETVEVVVVAGLEFVIVEQRGNEFVFRMPMPACDITVIITLTLPVPNEEQGNEQNPGDETGGDPDDGTDGDPDDETGGDPDDEDDDEADGSQTGDTNESNPIASESSLDRFIPIETMAMAGLPIIAYRRRKIFSLLKRGGRNAKTKQDNTRTKG